MIIGQLRLGNSWSEFKTSLLKHVVKSNNHKKKLVHCLSLLFFLIVDSQLIPKKKMSAYRNWVHFNLEQRQARVSGDMQKSSNPNHLHYSHILSKSLAALLLDTIDLTAEINHDS